MKKNKIFVILIVFFVSAIFSFLFRFDYSSAQEVVEISSEESYLIIEEDTTWTKETPDLVFDKQIVITNSATLTIEKGTRITFQDSINNSMGIPGIFVFSGKLIANGAKEEQVVFTSSEKGFSLSFSDNSQFSVLQNTTIENGGAILSSGVEGDFDLHSSVVTVDGGKLRLENSKFLGSHDKEVSISDADIYDENGDCLIDEAGNCTKNKASVEIINSNFSHQEALDSNIDCWLYDEDTGADYIDNECSKRVHLQDDWFGSPDGPTTDNDEQNGITKGYRVRGFYFLDSWRTTDEISDLQNCTENCFSNVLFLPGIKASRLYEDEDQIWVPNYFGNDLDQLRMDENGDSIEEIYTKDVLDEVAFPVVGGNIYKSFLGKLDDLKNGGVINEYRSFAYDWRRSVEDIAKNGTLYPDQATKSAIDEIRALSGSSKNKKVTIVAHSNGGLLAKALIMELEKSGEADKVDKIIFVATPQMGTPTALLSLLYGYDESALLSTLISKEDSRTLAENMPGAYGLLPSRKYFERLRNPFVSFLSENTRYEDFKEAYGENINSFDEWKDFLTGDGDGREEPEDERVDLENTLRENILEEAISMHERLDEWQVPENIEVIQIAGWGLDTISGVKYTEEKDFDCYASGGKVPSCVENGEYIPVYEPQFTVDGDKTVVTPSALMIPESENVKRYWLDLYGYNDKMTTLIDREHKDILEADPVLEFLNNILQNNLSSLPEYLVGDKPEGENSRLRMSLYSPLNIHLYDKQGNHTGPKKITVDGQEYEIFEEGIPNSYYYQFGEQKYVGFGSGENIEVKLEGYETGTYTLKIEEAKPDENGEEIISEIILADLPTTAETEVSLEIPEEGLEGIAPLEADIDGDGQRDYEVVPILGGVTTLDNIAPEGKIFFNPDSQKMEVVGIDNLSENVSVEMKEIGGINRVEKRMKNIFGRILGKKPNEISKTISVAILTDEAGNRSEIILEEKENWNNTIEYEIKSISYNGNNNSVSNSSLRYQWIFDKKKESFRALLSRLESGNNFIQSNYVVGKNETLIMENNKKPQKVPGMVVPYLQTEKGKVKISY